MPNSRKSIFSRLTNEKSRALISSSAQSARYKLSIWTQGQAVSLETRVVSTLESAGLFYISIPIGEAERAFFNELERLGIQECRFSLNLTTDILFFRADLRSSQTGSFRVKEPVYMVERRTDLRVRIPPSQSPSVSFELKNSSGTEFSGKILDISSSGLAIVLPGVENGDLFPLEGELRNLRFSFKGIDFEAAAVVKNKREINLEKQGPALRIGVLLKYLPAPAQSALYRAVVEESKRFANR